MNFNDLERASSSALPKSYHSVNSLCHMQATSGASCPADSFKHFNCADSIVDEGSNARNVRMNTDQIDQ